MSVIGSRTLNHFDAALVGYPVLRDLLPFIKALTLMFWATRQRGPMLVILRKPKRSIWSKPICRK